LNAQAHGSGSGGKLSVVRQEGIEADLITDQQRSGEVNRVPRADYGGKGIAGAGEDCLGERHKEDSNC